MDQHIAPDEHDGAPVDASHARFQLHGHAVRALRVVAVTQLGQVARNLP